MILLGKYFHVWFTCCFKISACVQFLQNFTVIEFYHEPNASLNQTIVGQVSSQMRRWKSYKQVHLLFEHAEMREGRSGHNSSQRVPNQTDTFNHEYRCEEIILDFHCNNFTHLFYAIVRAWEHSFDPENIYLAIVLEEESWSLFKIILVALESMDEDNETDTLRGCELSPRISGWEIVKN